MIHSLLLSLLMAVLSGIQFKAPQTPLNPFSIAEDYQRLYNMRLLNEGRDANGIRQEDDCDRYEVRLWSALGIPLDSASGIGGSRSFCVAELQQVDWDGDATQDVLLTLGGRVFRQYRDVLFVNGAAGLRYVGYLDGVTKYSDPAPRIVHFGSQSFLQTATTSGDSGMNKLEVTWSDLTPQGGRTVFTYPEEGAAVSSDLIRQWDDSVTEIDGKAGVIKIDLKVSYLAPAKSADDADTPLFSKTDQAVYRWSPDASKFELDLGRSTLTAEEIKQVFGYDVPLSGFLDWYLPQLVRLAMEGNEPQKTWLRSWLQHEADSPRKRTLLDRIK